jgi:nucleolar protein 56
MRASMGQEISDFDIECLQDLCQKTLRMFEFRREIQGYLKGRMEIVAPNLTSLIGETIAAKLISHSGSLATLSKYPASTIQILGAEKALFRALKQKTKTPKYGLLFNTTFIGRALGKNKGKISRYLANKCAMASRLDNYLVNVLIYLSSLPISSAKNLESKFSADLLDQLMKKMRLNKMKRLWTKLWMSSEAKKCILTLRKSSEKPKRSLKKKAKLRKLSRLKKLNQFKNKRLKRRRKLLKHDHFDNITLYFYL